MPDPTVPVRVTRGEFRYDREQYSRGDELLVHEGALEKHPNSLERVDDVEEPDEEPEPSQEAESDDESASNEDAASESEGDQPEQDEPADTDDGAESGTPEVDPHPDELTIDDLEGRVGDVDDVELLLAIRAEEVDGEDRKGAKEAIDARLDELEG